MVTFGLGFFGTIALVFARHPWGPPFSILFVATFIVLVLWHSKVRTALRKRVTYRIILEREVAVIERDWTRLPALPLYETVGSPRYYSDLDLVGESSLLRLLNTTLSNSGFQKLAALFSSNGITNDLISHRQAIVKELQAKRAFRRKLHLLGNLENDAIVDLLSLESFVDEPFHSSQAPRMVLAIVALYVLAIALGIGFIARSIGPYFLVPWFGAFLIFSWASSHFYNPFGRALTLEATLTKFSKIARLLESYRAKKGSDLAALLEPFQGSHRPSKEARKLSLLVSLLSTRANPLVYILVHIVFPLDYVVTLALESFRKRLKEDVKAWTTSFSELEAFLCLAGFADIFSKVSVYPALVNENTRAPHLEAKKVRHPLLNEKESIGNDFVLDEAHWCDLITGSNMSGKSTFLRTLGSNVLLAKAGAPVFAEAFRFSNCRLYTMLRVADSLEDHVSSFYAEVQALKEILDAANETAGPPVFYLIDEIFRGTNNRERLLGSRAYIEAMSKLRAGGLIATHDLELAELAQTKEGMSNFHFKEIIEGNKMRFSYLIASGPCPTTNALKIMEIAGLPVP